MGGEGVVVGGDWGGLVLSLPRCGAGGGRGGE